MSLVPEFQLPNYNNCLVNLSNSILKEFGVTPLAPTLELADKYLQKDYKNVVVLVLDALGISIIEKHLNPQSFFRSNLAGSFESVFPPTTVAATTSLMSGLYPNEHGWLGWDCYFPDLDYSVTIFRNTTQMTEKKDAKPKAFDQNGNAVWDYDSIEETGAAADYNVGFTKCPYKSIIQRINEAGGKAYFSMPFMEPYPQTLEAILERTDKLCKEPGKKFIYAYWNQPDGVMHETGTVSDLTHKTIIEIEEKVKKFSEGLKDTLLLITADHGHMNSKNECILDHPDVVKCLKRMPFIEPRALGFQVKDEYIDVFEKIFKENFGDEFWLLTKEEVLSKNVFGLGKSHKDLDKMIGDYLAISISDTAIFTTHFENQVTVGGHAGLTPEELAIPLIAVEL